MEYFSSASTLYDRLKEEKLLEKSPWKQIDLWEGMIEYIDQISKSEVREVEYFLKLLYQFMLKYKYYPTSQNTSWILAIFDCQISIKSLLENINIKNRITDDIIKDKYEFARLAAYWEMTESLKIPNIIPIDLYKQWNLDFILDKNSLNNFLLENAQIQEVKEYMDRYIKE